METAKLKDFTNQEYNDWLNRYSIMSKNKDFRGLMGLNTFSFLDYDFFRLSKQMTPTVMATFLNYFQNEDELKIEKSKKLFFALIDMDYETKEAHVLLENLSHKQFNENESFYLVLLIRRELPDSKIKKKIWQMGIFRLPDQQISIFFNHFPYRWNQEWVSLRKEMYAYFHVDFQDFDSFYKIPYDKYLNEGDSSVDIIWILYQFTRGVEVERIKYIQYDRFDFHRRLLWLLYKLRNPEYEDLDEDDSELEEIDYEWRQKIRYFRPNLDARRQPYDKCNAEIQTDFTVDSLLLFDFGKNYESLNEKIIMVDKSTETEENAVKIREQRTIVARKALKNQFENLNQKQEEVQQEEFIQGKLIKIKKKIPQQLEKQKKPFDFMKYTQIDTIGQAPRLQSYEPTKIYQYVHTLLEVQQDINLKNEQKREQIERKYKQNKYNQ